MGAAKKRKCKTCGRPFVPTGANDWFCSPLCRTTGCFVAGGGDTSKPLSPEQKKAAEKKAKKESSQTNEKRVTRVRGGAEKFPRVHEMFALPLEKRWGITKTFTAEERAYCQKLQKRMLQEEVNLDEDIFWESECCEEAISKSFEGLAGGRLGDSDDGTV